MPGYVFVKFYMKLCSPELLWQRFVMKEKLLCKCRQLDLRMMNNSMQGIIKFKQFILSVCYYKIVYGGFHDYSQNQYQHFGSMLRNVNRSVVGLIGQVWSQHHMSTLSAYHKKINPLNERHALLVYKLRSCGTIDEALLFADENKEEIQAIGKTMLLDYFNELYMDPRVKSTVKYIYVNNFIPTLKNLTFYQKCLKLGVLQKTKIFYMYNNDFVIHDKFVKESVDDLINELEKNKQIFTLNDYFNVLTIFRVQIHSKLVAKCLESLNKIILDSDQQTQYIKLWKIIVHQLTYYNWIQLRKYNNIIKFFTSNFHWAKNSQAPLIDSIQIFLELAQFKFHLVGERKVPKFMSQISGVLLQRIDEIHTKLVCLLLKAYSSLPAQFQLELRKELTKKLETAEITNHSEVRFPFESLSLQAIDKFFSKSQNFPSLWYCLLYCNSLNVYQKFLRGSVVQIFKKYLSQTANMKIEAESQVFSRISALIYYFYNKKDSETLENIKAILTRHIKQVEYSMRDLHLNNFLNLFLLFNNDPMMQELIQRNFLAAVEKKRNKSSLYQSNFLDICFVAIEFHLNTELPIVRQNVVKLINEIVPVISNSNEITHEELKLLILLIRFQSYKPNTFMVNLKKKIWSKIPDEQIQVMLQYYILGGRHSFQAFQEIFLQFEKRNVPFPIILKFLSSLGINELQNKRGNLEQNLLNYLNKIKQTLGSEMKSNGLKYLNEVTRLLGILCNFPSALHFNEKLYITTLNAISQEIWEDTEESEKCFSLKGKSSRAIVNFLMKFQEIFEPNNFSIHSPFLWKIYKIFCTILKQDNGPYLKTKFLQFSLVYKSFIVIPQGTEILPLFEVNKILHSAQNLPEFKDIIFIMLKLHCMGLEQLENNKVLQYSSLISMEIDSGNIPVVNIKDKVKATIFQLRLLNYPTKDSKYFHQILSPLFLKSIKAQNKVDIILLEPFLDYFFFTNEISQMEEPLILLLEQKINPAILLKISKSYPISQLTIPLFEAFARKAYHVSHLIDSSGTYLLYFLQRAFYQTPKEFSQIIDGLWEKVTTILEQKIKIIQSFSYSYQRSAYLLGQYSLYMYCCIKRRRTDTQVFKWLSKFVQTNSENFLKNIVRNQLLIKMSRQIYFYVCADLKIVNKNKFKVKQNFRQNYSLQYSQSLEQKLKSENVKFYISYEVENIHIPYYCQQSQQIIFVANQFNKNFAYDKQGRHKLSSSSVQVSIPSHGLFRFQIEVYRKLLPRYRIKVYNEFTGDFIQE